MERQVFLQITQHKKRANGGFPGGPVVKNPAANGGDRGSIPDPGRFHTPGGTEPMCLNYCSHPSSRGSIARSRSTATRADPAHHSWRKPEEQRRPRAAQNKKKLFKQMSKGLELTFLQRKYANSQLANEKHSVSPASEQNKPARHTHSGGCSQTDRQNQVLPRTRGNQNSRTLRSLWKSLWLRQNVKRKSYQRFYSWYIDVK